MSLFGSLRTSYTPPAASASRLPTVSDSSSDDSRGNGGNEFLSLVGEGTISNEGSSATATASIYSALSPEIAYRASLIGSMLDDVTNGNPSVDDPIGDLEAGASPSYDAADSADSEETTEELENTAADNTLPKADDDDGEVENPIVEVGGVTNALPQMDAPPV